MHILKPRTCDYVALHGKRSLQIDEVKDLEIGDDPGLFSGPSTMTSGFLRQRKEGQNHRRRCDDRSRGRVMWGHETRNVGGL